MPETINFILGFDPGGATGLKFGWSICREVDGQLEPPEKTGSTTNAWNALNQVKAALAHYNHQGDVHVLAAGIDAPLFWTKTGARMIDDRIREEMKATGGPPGPAQINSLYGAVSVQGPLLAKQLKDAWGHLTITECWPKGLEHLLAHAGRYRAEHRMVQRLTARLAAPYQEHQRDATLCAVSAWAAMHEPANWQDLYLLEPDPLTPFDLCVSYWMPIPS